jgi:hypothetical protein
MQSIPRREFISIVAAGCLAGCSPEDDPREAKREKGPIPLDSEANSSGSDLMQNAVKVAATQDDLNEDYFWGDDHTLLFLRGVPNKDVFHVVLFDTKTGQETLPEAFNAKNSPLMKGKSMTVSFEGSGEQEHHYLPPTAALSPDGKWLLWQSTSSFPDGQWIAATLDGQSQQWKQGSDAGSEFPGISTHPVWLRDSSGWVELVSRYANQTYTITQANLYRLGKTDPVKRIRIRGLDDGLLAGVTQDDRVMMHHPDDPRASEVTQAEFSRIGLDAETVSAQKLTFSLPTSADAADFILSPHGNRLAWILKREREPSRQYTLYIANADGTGIHPIGSTEGVQVGKGYSWPRDIRWLPDGKRLSFVFKKAVWVIPVP